MAKVAIVGTGVLIILAFAVVFLAAALFPANGPGPLDSIGSSLGRRQAVNAPSSADHLTDQELLNGDIMLSVDHALERHGPVSLTIKQQCESNPVSNRTRDLDGRKALGCEYEPGKFGVAIYEEDGEFVTAFPNRSKTLNDLLQYFQNRGYTTSP